MKPPIPDSQEQQSIGCNKDALLKALNTAFADEWIAYYQYWICAKIVVGPTRVQVASELAQHAQEELKHAELLSERIIALGGIPLLTHQEWSSKAGCGYDATKNAHVKAVLEENIKAEACAIRAYHAILDMIGEKDPVTYDIILSILADEVEHEVDLKRLLDDFNSFTESN